MCSAADFLRWFIFDRRLHAFRYVTFVEGLAGGNASNSGPRPSDGVNLWPALTSGGASPRTEVIHQVSNQHYNAITGTSYINGTKVSQGNGDGSLGMVRWLRPCHCMGSMHWLPSELGVTLTSLVLQSGLPGGGA